MPQRPTFLVKFEPLPRVDGVRALRALLKAALRRFGLRALDYRREESAAPAAPRSDHWRGSDRAHTRAPQGRDEMKPDEDMRKFAGTSFLKIEDLTDGPLTSEIVDVRDGKFDRPVVEFSSGHLLNLNATNCRVLCRDLGPLRPDWLGHPVELYAGETMFEGKAQPSVLVRVINPVPASKQKTPPPPRNEIDDEIPF